jgi:hypothetical protein
MLSCRDETTYWLIDEFINRRLFFVGDWAYYFNACKDNALLFETQGINFGSVCPMTCYTLGVHKSYLIFHHMFQ